MAEDEFGDFLNLENLSNDFTSYSVFDDNAFEPNFANLDAHYHDQPSLSQQILPQNGLDPSHTSDHLHSNKQFNPQAQAQSQSQASFTPMQNPAPQDPCYTPQAFHPHQGGTVMNHTLPQNHNAPPTPNSIGMHPHSAKWLHQPHLSHHQYAAADATMFTPIISPATEGMQNHVIYNSDSIAPGLYTLSPLTSPAMTPQTNLRGHSSNLETQSLDNSQIASPTSPDFGPTQLLSSMEQERPRKSRKKGPTSHAAFQTSRPRRSGATNNQKNNDSLNLKMLSSKVAKTPNSGPTKKAASDLRLAREGHSQNASTNSSISPRPLSEMSMAPPPKPSTPSSALKAPAQEADRVSEPAKQPPPATPASMMRIAPSSDENASKDGQNSLPNTATMSPRTEALDSSMEVLQLPEAAAPIVALKTAEKSGEQANKKVPQGKKEPKSKVNPKPSSSTSPNSSAVASPSGPTGISKPESKGGRGAKKRNSVSSTLVSPALRPKVSPSIKPLLREGANMNEQTQALLLASRSNYQNIIEGSHLPGVSYPSDLSTNLTSKRTSHKIAEQGRRNRINTALQEMQGLLPLKYSTAAAEDVPVDEVDCGVNGDGCATNATDEKDDKSANNANKDKDKARPESGSDEKRVGDESKGESGKKKANGASKNSKSLAAAAHLQSGNSKAATVENAIAYIRKLQADAHEKELEVETLKSELRKAKETSG